ncbi:MAG: proline--tRNA ligase [Proteobacteria bacterium]|nr:proline--tRNA ligase [Pseudomonadota bacterium]
MRLSEYFLPTLKENPSEAQIVSHRLMLRAGMIRQSSAGIYSWLPLGYRTLRRVEAIVRDEMNAAGCQEVLMPAIQPADLWRESGRYDDYGAEMLRITDRHQRDMVFGPTHEEVITDIFRNNIKSYRDLPKNLYQIQWKFRDEVRPRFGVMRGREFLMKDNYSFDLDIDAARRSYNRMFVAYLRTFARMGLKAIPMRAATGPIGGDMSHEFIILAETGESEVFCDAALTEIDVLSDDIDYRADLAPVVERWTGYYAATDEQHDPQAFDAQVDITKTATVVGPGVCTAVQTAGSAKLLVPAGGSVIENETFDVHCDTPSDHTLTVDNDIALQPGQHLVHVFHRAAQPLEIQFPPPFRSEEEAFGLGVAPGEALDFPPGMEGAERHRHSADDTADRIRFDDCRRYRGHRRRLAPRQFCARHTGGGQHEGRARAFRKHIQVHARGHQQPAQPHRRRRRGNQIHLRQRTGVH